MKRVCLLSIFASLLLVGCNTHSSTNQASASGPPANGASNGTSVVVDNTPSGTQTPAQPGTPAFHVVEKMFKTDKQTVSWPELQGMTDSRVQAVINRQLKAAAMPANKPDGPALQGDYTYSSSYSVIFEQGTIIDFEISFYFMPAGAAHGMPRQQSLVLDLKTGKEYGMKDLFRPGAAYLQEITRLIRRSPQAGKLDTFQTFKGVADKDGFYLIPGGFGVYFSPYEWTPFADGFPAFPMSFSDVDGILNKDGQFWRNLHDDSGMNNGPWIQTDEAKIKSLGYTPLQVTSQYSYLAGFMADTADSSGSTLYAIAAQPAGRTDGSVTKVFFFNGSRYLGTDTLKNHGDVENIYPSNLGTIAVVYNNGGKKPYQFTIHYHWDGQRLVPDASFPAGYSWN